MKQFLAFFIFLFICSFSQSAVAKPTNEPDSVYVFAYSTGNNKDHNGLHFAWSVDGDNWLTIGPEHSFLRCDYGRWGAEKRMLSPFLFYGADGMWHCVWSLNEYDAAFAHVVSQNLFEWNSQSYPFVKTNNFLRPVVVFDKTKKLYIITYTTSDDKFYAITTVDFKSFSEAIEVSAANYPNLNKTIDLSQGKYTGQVHKVAWSVVDGLIKHYELRQFKNSQNDERAEQDALRFAGLKSIDATITAQIEKKKPISDMLIGVFFEDINYAADGGLYAELIQNRDFEYALSDKEGHDPAWNSTHSWTTKGDISFIIDTVNPVHVNNLHYAILKTSTPAAALVNAGFDGIPVRKGDKYDFTIFTKQIDAKNGSIFVRLVNKSNQVLAQTIVKVSSNEWKKTQAKLIATGDANDAVLELQPVANGSIAVDVISLFPQKTFKNRKNGLRADLAQFIADLHPRFVRFPGGCVAHGDGLANIYKWKNTVGDIETRKPQRNLWGYHQTAGLGYFEYFQFCEDIGAVPLPVIAAGVPCQNSGVGGGGQQGGVPMCDMDDYVQDILDLIEYANGDAKNTKWGRVRAKAGHPKPFNLKYLGIGNEDLITYIFEERFTMIFNKIKEKHPEIVVIGTVGPFYEGSDYREGWKLATKLGVPMVDEHYYVSPGWFVNNQDFYDRYDRSKSKVYLGEYASHLPGRPSNIETALSEALYLTAVERNADVVRMTSYAPLLAKDNHTQWKPDLIYFNNTEVKPTVNYYVQMLYGQNSGDEYIPAKVILNNSADNVRKRVATSIVRDSKTGDVIVKMVNMLPVDVSTTLNTDGLISNHAKAVQSVLSGKPTDENARPVISSVSIAKQMPCVLPAYSFTVIRFSTF